VPCEEEERLFSADIFILEINKIKTYTFVVFITEIVVLFVLSFVSNYIHVSQIDYNISGSQTKYMERTLVKMLLLPVNMPTI
jgi:hypothetical protein